ncbi:unnamed protein product [Urochloa decumbens]|uniref:Uncharacterized protein n=1 Tax=Urochloa decumbens TaxID=240449 RepID=A0ABC8ZXW4_9POAL
MDRSEMVDSTGGDRRVTTTNKLRIEVDDSSASDNSDREEHEAREAATAREAPPPPPPWNHYSHPLAAGAGVGSNRRRLLSKQLSMKETTREAKWEKRRRQILRRSGLVPAVRDQQEGNGGGGGGLGRSRSAASAGHHVVRSSSERAMRCLTDEDLDELRGSFELGFGFDEETGGAHLRDTLPALDFYFAVSRQLSDPKLRSLPAASPTSTLSAVSSASTLPDTPSPRSPNDAGDPWKIFSPGENPQLVKTRLRHWAQVVACTIKHGC